MKYILKYSMGEKWVEKMTGIGPCLTSDKSKAKRFDSRADAGMSPEASNALCPTEIEEVES